MTHVVASVSPFEEVGRSLREAVFMLWETLWALVLGFTLSGMVQAFASTERMQAKLGTHRPAALARATGYGMVSSSCSYAASAMAKSLFAKGADFVSAMVFMVASTNLVVEVGLVALVMLGWQFTAAEFVGGTVMIVLLALLGGLVFPFALVAAARRRVTGEDHGDDDHSAAPDVSVGPRDERTSFASNATSVAAWSDAATYAVADVKMLRKELVIGYTVAGFLTVLVPAHLWNAVFLHGHGSWTTVENALVGPLVAMLSWVCSIGNVPLAAALWSGGISFGGVLSFLLADLIAMPVVLVYRKLYGWRMTVRIAGLFYVLMATAGILTEGMFRTLGRIPTTRTLDITAPHFAWNYTTLLNIVFLLVAVVVWCLAKTTARSGGGKGCAIDPVCGMQVRTADAPAHAILGDRTVYFCSDRCSDRFGLDGPRIDLPSSSDLAAAQAAPGSST